MSTLRGAELREARATSTLREPFGDRAKSALRLLGAVLALITSASVHAHATSTTYLVAAETTGHVAIAWDLPVAELHWALDLDDDGDGRIRWAEIEAHRAGIESLALSQLAVAKQEVACPATLHDVLLTSHASEPYLSLALRARCPVDGKLAIAAGLFLDASASRRTLIDISTAAGHFTATLSSREPRWLQPEAPSALATFVDFIGQGTWHVWIGYDHLAFLVLLLLPSVRRGSKGGEICRDLLKIVTAFTLAHSITLGLAATDTVRLPVQAVELTIAASIVVAAALNLFPAAGRWRLPLAFGFGLVHGFGFANALAETGSQGTRLVPVLAGFNIGVELAQLSVVGVLLPVLLWLRNSPFYAARLVPAASMAMMLAGAAWLAARA
jgi:hypothetical protein